MPPARITRVLVAVSCATLLAACGSRTRQHAAVTRPVAVTVRTDSAAIARARADSARYPYTAADIEFMSEMIGHHSQALVIAEWAATHGASAAVRRLADRIINGQQDEIVTMKQWLVDRNQPLPGAHHSGMGAGHATAHGMAMPGMLSDVQLKRLDAARGPEFDRLFLTLMIQHHRGAVAMVEKLFASYGAAQDQTVFKFASDVNVDQTTEIDRMESMLDALPSRSDTR